MKTCAPFAFSLLLTLTSFGSLAAESAPAENITRQEYQDPNTNTSAPYLLYTPIAVPEPEKRALLIFLYGAGGSIENYNIKRPPYAQLRAQWSERGYHMIVPELGKQHFMSDQAKATLDGIVAQVLAQQQIPGSRVHVMGTSMGAGSSLAYAIHRPNLIQSVCAVMPMTDFATWVVENPRYHDPVAKAYGGTYEEKPEAYERNSAIKNIDVFAKIPVMLIHGNADPVVVYENSQRLARLLQEKNYPVTFLTAEGQAHKDDVMQPYQSQAMAFFEAAME